MTMAKLAGDDITRGAIFLFESGRARPSQETLHMIARRTRKPLSFFLSEPAGMAMESDQLVQARTLLAAGQAERAAGHVEAALDSARRARSLAVERDADPWLEIECRLLEVEALYAAADPIALAEASDALDDARRLVPRAFWVERRLLAVIGSAHADSESWSAAAAAYEQALGGGTIGQAVQQEAEAREAIARHQAAAGRRLDALGYAAAAAALRALHEDLTVEARTGTALGIALWRAGSAGEAATRLHDVLERCRELGLEGERCRALIALAEVSLGSGDLAGASGHLEQAFQLAAELGDRSSAGAAHVLEARLAVRRGDTAAAERACELAVALFGETGEMDRLVQAHVVYAEVLESKGAIKEALDHWKQATNLVRPGLMS
jgi:transcriptional regulator with XRE-family HTH domain